MKTAVEGKNYFIAGITSSVTEKNPIDGGGYKIFDGLVDGNPNVSSCRFEIPPGMSSTPVLLHQDSRYEAIRAITKGSGYLLLWDSVSDQLNYYRCHANDDTSYGISPGIADCMIADSNGTGLEVIEIGSPPFRVDMESSLHPEDPDVPSEFFKVKQFLQNGDTLNAQKLVEAYKQKNGH